MFASIRSNHDFGGSPSSPVPRRIPLLAGVAVPLVLLAACTNTGGETAEETDGVVGIAMYEDNDRQEMLEEGAREEGTLTLFSSTGTTPIGDMVSAFQAKYPFIEIQIPCCPSDPAGVVTRATAEFEAGRTEIDVIETFPSGVNVLSTLDVLTPFKSPNEPNYPPDTVGEDGIFLSTRTVQRGLAINTDRIPLEEAPTSWDDLLDPKWKDKITIAGGEAAVRLVAFLLETQGEDYLEALSAQNVTVIEASARAVADQLVSGELQISPTITLAHIAGPIEDGAPVAWVPLAPIDSASTVIALSATAPHPHASMLFIDFVTSEEGQQIYVDNGYESLLPALVAPENEDLDRVYVDFGIDYIERESEYVELVEQYFGN